MLHTIGWFMEKGLEVVCLLVGLWMFGYICKHGTGAVKDLIRTIGLTVKALCKWIQDKLSDKEEDPIEETEKGRTSTQEIEVKLTYDELEEFLKKRRAPTL